MRRRFRRLRATALINGNIDDDRARFHVSQHAAGDQFGRSGSRNQNRADDKIRLRDETRQGLLGRENRLDARAELSDKTPANGSNRLPGQGRERGADM